MTSYLTTLPQDPGFDLPTGVGQRSCTFRFRRTNGVTGEELGDLTPVRAGTLTHDTTRTIKRQLDFDLGIEDSDDINPITDRIYLYLVDQNGVQWPLGRYMFTSSRRQVFTSGELTVCTLADEMFLVDQQITTGISGDARDVAMVIREVLESAPGRITGAGQVPLSGEGDTVVQYDLEGTPYRTNQVWAIGSNRGTVLNDLAVTGDYRSPWFGNDYRLHFIRTTDPALEVPAFDWDEGNQVLRSSIVESDDLLTAINRYVVVSNAATNPSTPVVGIADVPADAPYSIENRGFVVAQVFDLQVSTVPQAQAAARNLVLSQSVLERTIVATTPDPRHDSYDVIKWRGDLWLEVAWSMNLSEGGEMAHNLIKAYLP